MLWVSVAALYTCRMSIKKKHVPCHYSFTVCHIPSLFNYHFHVTVWALDM